MSKSLHQLNLNEFAALVRGLNWQRRITGILVQQPHLPDSPYIGLASMEKMWEDDVGVKQWSDLAQHITIAPDGSIWTGRGWNIPPARMGGWDSQPAEEVPFLVRIIGNYSNERDPFGGVARETLIAVAATLLDQFKLKVTSLRMDEADALVDSTALHKAVTAYRSKARSKQTKGNGQALLKAQQRKVDQLLPVLAEVSDDWKTEGTFPVEDGQGVDNRGILDKKWSVSEKEKLSRHVINLRAGKFTPSGDFTTTAEDVTRLFGQHVAVALAAAKAQGRKFRVLFWAHGGLVKEKDALQYALNHIDGWISAGIYPIYFIWETNALTALKDLLRGQRSMDDRGLFDLIGNANDAMWEQTLHVPGMALWGKMKEYAANGVQPDGGALFTAKKLAAFAKSSGPGVEFYACGHSAGSIFHAHFLPSVGQQGGPVFKDLFLLAPAITVADFRTHLERQIGPGKTIEHTTLFTMNSIAELADNVGFVYRKSLLYLVSRACEPMQPTPILGLEESLTADPVMPGLFGIGSVSARGAVVWSPNHISTGPSASNSTTHGGFDNDHTTLNSMARRITEDNTITPFTEDRSLAVPSEGRTCKALCVGINDYPYAPLAGCVNDALQWQAAFMELGYHTILLTNSQATRAGILQALEQLIAGSKPGDSLIFQYAGHGTQVEDVNQDETDDSLDEALVPADYESGEFLIDDDLGLLFSRLPDGVNLTCFIDSCHAGTATRDLLGFGRKSSDGVKERFLPMTRALMEKYLDRRRHTASADRSSKDNPYQGKPEIVFAACLPRQTAKESGGHGYFTSVVCPMLKEAVGRLTHDEFLKAIHAQFPLPPESQKPELDCSPERQSRLLLDDKPRAAGDSPPLVMVSTATAPQTINAQILVETMRDYLQVLKRLV